LKLVEVLVGLKDNTILTAATDCIFQNLMSAMIIYVYLESASALLVPLHGCWLGPAHLVNVYNSVSSAYEYVF